MANIGDQIRRNVSRNISRATGVKRSTSSSTKSYDPRNQVSNYQTRLRGMGVNPEDATDDRNWLEKALNLEKDQNLLFDIFEILNRPQNALFSGIKAVQEGEDFFEGLKSGITGETKTSGKDLLVNAGMDDTEGQLDLSDILGFGLDVFADPIDIPMIPVKGVAKGAKIADKAMDTTRLISPAQGIFRGAGKGIKKVAGLADTGIEKVLGKIDNKVLRNAERVASETGKPLDNILRQLGGKSDLLGNYQSLKKGISNSIDSSKMLGGLVGKTRKSANSVNTAEEISRRIETNLEDLSRKTAEKLNMNPDKLAEELSIIIESEQKTGIDALEWLKKLGADNNTFEGTTESVEKLKNLIKENAPSIKFKNSTNPNKLVIDTKKSKFLDDFKNNKDIKKALSNLNLEKDLGYNEAEKQLIESLKEKFNSNKDLKNLLKEHEKGYSRIADAYKEYAGVDFDFARQPGYIRKAQGDLQTDASKIIKSDLTGNIKGKGLINEKTFGTREYASGLVANRQKQEELINKIGGELQEDGTKSIGKIQKRQQNLETKLYENRKETLKVAREKVSESLEKAKNFNINATKLGEKETKIRGAIESTRNNLVDVQKKLNDKTINRINNIKDASLHNSFSKHTQKVSEYTKEYNSIIEQMSKKNIPDTELKKLTAKSEKLQEQINKVNAQIDGDLIRINNYVDKKTLTQINQTNTALKKASALGGRGERLSNQLSKNLTNQKILKQSNQDMIDSLEKKLKTIDLQLGSLSPERDAIYKKEIARLEKAKSLLESNEAKELFNLNYHMGMKDFIDQASQYSKGAKIYNDALLYGTFNDENVIKIIENSAEKTPRGFVKVDGTKLQKQFDAIKDLLPDKSSDALQLLAENYTGKKLLLDKDFANLINVIGKSNEEANGLVKLIDGFNNTFKKYKILTPGFQVRNIAGNATNMALSGVPINKIPEYYAKATGILNSADDLLDKVAKGVKLTGKDADNWKLLQQFYEGGFTKAGTKLQDLEELREKVLNKKGPLNWLTKKNADLNESIDAMNRMALLMYANDTPKYVEKLGKSNAIDAVKYALMDPSNMSDFEKTTMKKIIPFYTFTKQNLLYQATNIMNNTPKYNRLIKGLNSIYGNLNENEYFNYQKEGMQLPLPITDSNGNRIFLKTNLPLSDLGEWMSNPVQRTLASTSPLIRTPFEMVTGKNIFTGKDSYYNALSDAYETVTGNKPSEGVSNAMAKAEQILAGLGVDTISTNMLKKVTSAVKTYNGNMDSQAMWAEIFRSILQNTNQEKIEKSRAYEDLSKYQAYIKQLKNQGIEVPTIKELNNQSKRSLRRVQNRRKSR